MIAISIWLLGLIACGALFYRMYWVPRAEKKAQEVVTQAEQDKMNATSSDSQYRNNVRFGIDSFSGNAVFRTQEFRNHLRRANTKVDLVDDGADYNARLEALQSGDLQMAVFTIDALIAASDRLDEIPAVIVAFVDETRGADAMLAYKKTFPNLDSLNDPKTRFVLTPDSPSETLARVMMASFNLDQLDSDPFITVDGAQAVYEHYRKNKDTDPYVYVVWQPFASKILDNPNAHVIIDSSRFKGYIVDVIVANRDFLYKNPDAVKVVVQSYLRAYYEHSDNMVKLVMEDSRQLGQPLSQKQAEDLVKGIWWKNTQENYAHMGKGTKTLQHIEDMILNLTTVLKKTNAIDGDPTDGHPEQLYYNQILGDLADANFHPGLQAEKVRSENDQLQALSETEWEKLVPVGTLEVPKLVFARGTSKLSTTSNIHLDELNEKLKSFPTYYVLVRGNASTQGDLDANRILALQRAKAAESYLLSVGVHQNRIRAVAGEPTGSTSVNFILGEQPY